LPVVFKVAESVRLPDADELAFGQTGTVRVQDYDRYGRTVAEIILPDGRSLNEEMVKAGLAWWYRQ
jgi:endonuclease YncB( thermonuclease family)